MNYNMYAGAFLGTVFVLMTVGIASDTIFYSPDPKQEGFAIAVLDDGAASAEPEEEVVVPIGVLLAGADASNGPGVFRKCQACHNVESGGAHKTGPNLWNLVGKEVALYDDFRYSSSMQAYAEGGTVWNFEALNNFLKAPKDYIDGTSMGFAGLNRENERADLIAWFATQADTPVSLPSPEDAAVEEPAADTDTAEEGDAASSEGATTTE